MAELNQRAPLPTGADRQHFRADGLVKMGWSDKGVAKRAARRSGTSTIPDVYRCPICRLWHHGHAPVKR